MKSSIKIRDKYIGDGHKCFLTFEAGPTHDGFQTAISLVDAAIKAGGDAIKFQILDTERLIFDKSQTFDYQILKDRKSNILENKSEKIYDILKRRELSKDEWIKIKNYCDEKNISFFATVAFDDEIDFVNEIGCESIKIASADLNHIPLIEKAASTGKIIQIDTGSSSLSEIEIAVDHILKKNNSKIIIHHCPSGYPAKDDQINMNIITTLKNMYDYPIAYSDHSPGFTMDIVALTLGVNLIEKTITLNKETPQVEHVMSLEPKEMVEFVSTVRLVEKSFGLKRKYLNDVQIKSRNKNRRSIVLEESVKKNSKLKDVKVRFSRPGDGISPSEYINLLNYKFRDDLEANTKIFLKDLYIE